MLKRLLLAMLLFSAALGARGRLQRHLVEPAGERLGREPRAER